MAKPATGTAFTRPRVGLRHVGLDVRPSREHAETAMPGSCRVPCLPPGDTMPVQIGHQPARGFTQAIGGL